MHYIHQKGTAWIVSFTDFEDILHPVRRRVAFETKADAEAFSATLTAEQHYRQNLVAALEAVQDVAHLMPRGRNQFERDNLRALHDRVFKAIQVAQAGPLALSSKQKHRVLKRGEYARVGFRVRERLLFIERHGMTCAYCQRESGTTAHDPDGNPWHIDHMTPVSRGGIHHPVNWTLSCRDCNLAKHNKSPEEWQQQTAMASVQESPKPATIDGLQNDGCVSYSEARTCELLKLSRAQLKSMIDSGSIRAVRLGKRTTVIPREEIERFVS